MKALKNTGEYTRELGRSVKKWTRSDAGQMVTWLAAFAIVTLCFAVIGLLSDHLQ